MEIEKVLDVIVKTYSEDHELTIFTNGKCGIEAPSGLIEIDFKSLDELYKWAEK